MNSQQGEPRKGQQEQNVVVAQVAHNEQQPIDPLNLFVLLLWCWKKVLLHRRVERDADCGAWESRSTSAGDTSTDNGFRR